MSAHSERSASSPIFLCGFMGTGKTTVGKLLAEKLDCSFADLDDIIVEDAGMSIPEIFAQEGEAGFRNRERRCLFEQLKKPDGVLALGGGALHNQEVIDRVKEGAVLVFIDTPISAILARIAGDTNRPLLNDDDGNPKPMSVLEEEMGEKRQQRLPRYRQAHITIRPEPDQKPEQIVEELLAELQKFHGPFE